MATPDEAKSTRLMRLFTNAHLIGTKGVVLDISRMDEARLGSDEIHKLIEGVRRNRWDRDSEDSLIAATASGEADTLVTDDGRLMKRLGDANVRCDVIDFSEFQRRLELL